MRGIRDTPRARISSSRGSCLAASCPVRPEWKERDLQRIQEYRLPESRAERQALAETIGSMDSPGLPALADPLTPAWLREVPALEILHRV
jgi:transposase